MNAFRTRTRLPTLQQVTADWRQWTRLVRLVADCSPARNQVDRLEYERTYYALRADCEQLAEHGEPRVQPVFRTLHSLVLPWLSWESLLHADPIIVQELWLHCQSIEQRLWQRRQGYVSATALWRCAVFAILLMLGAGILAVCWWMGAHGRSGIANIPGWRALLSALARLSPEARLLTAGGAIAFVAFLLLGWLQRR